MISKILAILWILLEALNGVRASSETKGEALEIEQLDALLKTFQTDHSLAQARAFEPSAIAANFRTRFDIKLQTLQQSGIQNVKRASKRAREAAKSTVGRFMGMKMWLSISDGFVWEFLSSRSSDKPEDLKHIFLAANYISLKYQAKLSQYVDRIQDAVCMENAQVSIGGCPTQLLNAFHNRISSFNPAVNTQHNSIFQMSRAFGALLFESTASHFRGQSLTNIKQEFESSVKIADLLLQLCKKISEIHHVNFGRYLVPESSRWADWIEKTLKGDTASILYSAVVLYRAIESYQDPLEKIFTARASLPEDAPVNFEFGPSGFESNLKELESRSFVMHLKSPEVVVCAIQGISLETLRETRFAKPSLPKILVNAGTTIGSTDNELSPTQLGKLKIKSRPHSDSAVEEEHSPTKHKGKKHESRVSQLISENHNTHSSNPDPKERKAPIGDTPCLYVEDLKGVAYAYQDRVDKDGKAAPLTFDSKQFSIICRTFYPFLSGGFPTWDQLLSVFLKIPGAEHKHKAGSENTFSVNGRQGGIHAPHDGRVNLYTANRFTSQSIRKWDMDPAQFTVVKKVEKPVTNIYPYA